MARFIAGDELGGLKTVSFLRSDDKITVNSILTGGEDKKRAVQRLATLPSSSSPESVLLASAHADGSACTYTLSSEGELETIKEWTEPRLKAGQKYVGLAFTESGVYSCTSNGALRRTKLSSHSSENVPEETSSQTAVLPMRLADWALSPSSHTFAYAGDEVELSLWDTERAFAARTTKPVANTGEGKKKRKRDEELLPGETWRARNVPNDSLSLRQPVRNTTLAFLNGRDGFLAVGTAFGDVRRYDVRAQKRPVANWQGIGKAGGIAAVASAREGEHEVYVSDNGSSVFALDARTGKILCGYPGISGGVHAIATGPSGLVASAARDRYVRVHSTPGAEEDGGGSVKKGDGKGKVLDKTYFKSVPSALVWDGIDAGIEDGDDGDEESDDDDDDVWEGMAVVEEDEDDEEGDNKKARRKRAKGETA
ncbi:hypothetical protein PENSPDRAFT_575348 [Peniophora sp. CONT]|nr:hypothetical protein PENSPDRAFT_575348 [Peniophora sp. CONT]